MVSHVAHLYDLVEWLVIASIAASSAALGIVRRYLGYLGASLVLGATHNVPRPTDPG